MATFFYKVKDKSGSESLGTIDASNRQEAAKELRAQQLLILQLSDKETLVVDNEYKLSFSERVSAKLPVGQKDKILFYKQLAMMLRSGMTITSAINLLAEESYKIKFKRSLFQIVEDLQNGISLSKSAEKHRKIFSPMAVKIISAAELSGEMDKSLIQIADSMAYWSEIKGKVLQSMMYPFVVLLTVIGVSTFMVFSIIPKFEKFLNKSGKQLPWLTQLIIDISDFIRGNIVGFIITAFLLAVVIMLAWRKPKSRMAIENVILRIPLIGKVFLFAALSQFAGTVSLLLHSGLTVLDAMKVMTNLASFQVYRELYAGAEQRLMMGQSLKNSVQSVHIPRTMNNVIAVGEETGELPSVLSEIGEFYAERLKQVMAIMTALIEPMLLLFVGLLVGIVYIGLFMAILALATGR